MQKNDDDHQIGAPSMNLTVEPTHVRFRHDEFDTLKRFVDRRPIINEKQDARQHLTYEQKKRHASQRMKPADILGKRFFKLMLDGLLDLIHVKALTKPFGYEMFHV